MNLEELIKELKKIKKVQDKRIERGDMCGDFDDDHIKADELLLEYIDNEDVTDIFESIEKWYS